MGREGDMKGKVEVRYHDSVDMIPLISVCTVVPLCRFSLLKNEALCAGNKILYFIPGTETVGTKGW